MTACSLSPFRTKGGILLRSLRRPRVRKNEVGGFVFRRLSFSRKVGEFLFPPIARGPFFILFLWSATSWAFTVPFFHHLRRRALTPADRAACLLLSLSAKVNHNFPSSRFFYDSNSTDHPLYESKFFFDGPPSLRRELLTSSSSTPFFIPPGVFPTSSRLSLCQTE